MKGKSLPSIDSLKELSRFFSVTIDEMICSREMITAAEDDKKAMLSRYASVICNALDTLTAVMLILPVFGNGSDAPASAALFELTGIQSWLKVVFIAVIGTVTLNGICGVILCCFDQPVLHRHQVVTGMALSVLSVGIFIGTRQPYAGIICFAILIIKTWMIIRSSV